MSRFETVIFDDFSDGEQCDIVEPTKKSFKMSNQLAFENGKIKLAKDIKNDVFYALSLYLDGLKCAFTYSDKLYILGNNEATGENRIKRIDTSGNITTIHTFTGGGNELFRFFIFRDKAIVSMLDGTYKIQYASLVMTSWTNCNTIGAGYVMKDFVIVDNRLFVLCQEYSTDENRIYYSDDGISFTLLTTLDSKYGYNDFNSLDGYFYLRLWKYSGENELIRITTSGEIQEEVITADITYNLKTFVFNGHLYFLVDKRFLYRVVGSSLEPVLNFENDVLFMESSGIIDFVSFWDSTDDEVITMNLSEKISRPFKVPSALTRIYSLHKVNNNYTFLLGYLSSDGKVAIYDYNYISPGSVQTYTFRPKKGSFSPIQLTVLHKPLTANAWVKVYIKKDGASSWGSAVIDSNTTSAIKKSYDFPTGDDLRTIEFKIEYGTNDDAETPEDAILEFVYLPLELANSK